MQFVLMINDTTIVSLTNSWAIMFWKREESFMRKEKKIIALQIETRDSVINRTGVSLHRRLPSPLDEMEIHNLITEQENSPIRKIVRKLCDKHRRCMQLGVQGEGFAWNLIRWGKAMQCSRTSVVEELQKNFVRMLGFLKDFNFLVIFAGCKCNQALPWLRACASEFCKTLSLKVICRILLICLLLSGFYFLLIMKQNYEKSPSQLFGSLFSCDEYWTLHHKM